MIISAMTGKDLYYQILATGYSQEEIDQVLYQLHNRQDCLVSSEMVRQIEEILTDNNVTQDYPTSAREE